MRTVDTVGTALWTVYVVVPADVDDAAVPSGGNTYDRRVCAGLASIGWSVNQIPVAGSWPLPDVAARVALARSLDALPDGAGRATRARLAETLDGAPLTPFW